MEIVQERIEREFGIDLIATAPSVIYNVEMTDGVIRVDNPAQYPDPQRLRRLTSHTLKHKLWCLMTMWVLLWNSVRESVETL